MKRSWLVASVVFSAVAFLAADRIGHARLGVYGESLVAFVGLAYHYHR